MVQADDQKRMSQQIEDIEKMMEAQDQDLKKELKKKRH